MVVLLLQWGKKRKVFSVIMVATTDASESFMNRVLGKVGFSSVSGKRKDREHTGATPEGKSRARDFLEGKLEGTTLGAHARDLKKELEEELAREGGEAVPTPKGSNKGKRAGKGKGKGRFAEVKPITGQGSVEARLGVIERMMVLLMSLVSRHDNVLRMEDKDRNRVLLFHS